LNVTLPYYGIVGGHAEINSDFLYESFDYRISSLSIARRNQLVTSLILGARISALWHYSLCARALTGSPAR
jgi:hypothetical protein